MRLRYLACLLVAVAIPATILAGGSVQVWPKIAGVPNFGVGLPDAQNGQHPMSRESYGEGWFWLGRYDDGTATFANFMITNLGPGDNKGTVDLTIWEPNGTTTLRRVAFKAGTMSAATNRLDVKIGANHVSGSGSDFHINISEGGVALDMDYHAELPGFAKNSGRVTYGKDDDYYSLYVTIPRARLSGTITTPSGTRQVTGYGYSDHGVVTMMPYEYSKRWYTLRCFDKRYTIDIVEFTTPDKWGGTRVAMAIVGKDGKILYGGPDYRLDASDVRTEPKSKSPYPTSYHFTVDQPGQVKVDGTYKLGTMMHAIDVIDQLSFIERQVASLFTKTYIMRFTAQVEATVTLPDGTTESFTAPGVAEVVQFK